MTDQLAPLASVPSGARVTVVSFCGGLGFQRRIISMGLKVGDSIDVLQGGDGRIGPVLVAAGATRIAIGHGMAQKVLVRVGEGS